MKKLRKILSFKVIICLTVFISLAVALVSYQAEINITPVQQFVTGTTTASWNVYVNQVNIPCYLPGGTSQPTLDTGDSSTFAFKATTDENQVMAVKIELVETVDSATFSKFDITVLSWTGSSWTPVTLYNAASGTTTKANIDGTNATDIGYVHQAISTTAYYLVKATYSYDKSDSTAASGFTLKYTPLPADAF
jgi:hypothetical protein